MVVHGSDDIGDVLVKVECRFHDDPSRFLTWLEYVIGWFSMMIGGGVLGDGTYNNIIT